MNVQFPRFDLYRELGVDPTASQDDIAAAWQEAVASARAAGADATRIQRLNTAQQWLGDPDRRAQYDRERSRQRSERRQAPPAAAPVRAQRPRAGATARSGRGIPGIWLAAGLAVAVVAVGFLLLGPLRGGPPGGGGPASSANASPSTLADTCPSNQPDALPAGETRLVTIETEKGSIAITVEADRSPIAAGNFVALASCGYYDDVVFHRLVPGFVIQGGDPDGTGRGGPGYTIQDEPVTGQYGRGVVAMARTDAPNSVGSQFFIVLDDGAREALARFNTYQIIGTVTGGMETVDAIAAMPNSGPPGNSAVDPVAMTRVTVTTP